MATLEVRSVDATDEVRAFQAHGGAAMVHVAGRAVGRGTFEPGWRWSQDVKPIAGTESCQTAHFGYVLSGRMHIALDDGTEAEVGPGDVVVIPPGHDAWTVGDEACVLVDFGDVETYARPG